MYVCIYIYIYIKLEILDDNCASGFEWLNLSYHPGVWGRAVDGCQSQGGPH